MTLFFDAMMLLPAWILNKTLIALRLVGSLVDDCEHTSNPKELMTFGSSGRAIDR